MENMVAISSQLTDESTEALEIDVAHIYLQAIEVEPKKRRVYGLCIHSSTFYPESVLSSSSASTHYNTHYNTLFDDRLREERKFKKICIEKMKRYNRRMKRCKNKLKR